MQKTLSYRHREISEDENERQPGLRQIAIHDVQVSAANTAGPHFEQDLIGVGAWSGQVGESQRIALGIQNQGLMN